LETLVTTVVACLTTRSPGGNRLAIMFTGRPRSLELERTASLMQSRPFSGQDKAEVSIRIEVRTSVH
jgi:hypothetical protein